MPQIYGWISEGAKQGKSRTRPMPEYKHSVVIRGGAIVVQPNITDIKGPIWDGSPPNQ